MTGPDLVEVHLLRVPVPLWDRAKQQHDALQREFALLSGDSDGDGDVPTRLLQLVAGLQAEYGGGTTAQEEQLLDAVDDGAEEVPDLLFLVPPAVGPHVRDLGLLLDEADEHCRSGEHLLTLAADDELVRFRWWYLDQFTDQAAGRPPVAWPDYRRPDR